MTALETLLRLIFQPVAELRLGVTDLHIDMKLLAVLTNVFSNKYLSVMPVS